MIGGRLTMRAQILRNAATTRDAWGQPVAPDMQPLGNPVACFVWSTSAREAVNDDRSAMIEDVRGMFPLSTDLAADDELESVTDRAGRVVHFGRLKVEGPVQFKHNHLEAALRRIG